MNMQTNLDSKNPENEKDPFDDIFDDELMDSKQTLAGPQSLNETMAGPQSLNETMAGPQSLNDENFEDKEVTLDAVYQTLSSVLSSLARENAILNKKQTLLQDQFNVLLVRAEEYEVIIQSIHTQNKELHNTINELQTNINNLQNTVNILNAKIVSVTKQFTAALSKK